MYLKKVLSAVISCSMVILGLIIVITMRITLPTILTYDEQFLFNEIKFIVIRVYISLSNVILAEMLLIYLSVKLVYMTIDWTAVLYLPLLIYSMHYTYATCVVYLGSRITGEYALKFLSDHWQRYFEHDDPFWIELQTKLDCCGLESPRTYLEYLRKVPPTCFRPHHEGNSLIIRGCEDVVYDHFNGVRLLSKGLGWLALGLQFVMFIVYVHFISKKCIRIFSPRLGLIILRKNLKNWKCFEMNLNIWKRFRRARFK